MNPQTYTTFASQGQKAEYKLVIPIININKTCKLEILDKSNSVLKADQSNESEFILKRCDPLGDYLYTISLYDTSASNPTKPTSQQTIIVRVLDVSAEPDSDGSFENRIQVLELIKQVNVESGAGMGGAWIKGANVPASWRKLNQQFNGQETELLCEILEEAHDFKIYWVAINFLSFSTQEISEENMLMRILRVVSDHLPDGGHVQTAGLQLVQSLDLPKQILWKSLLSSLKVTAPNISFPIIKLLVQFIPEDGIQQTSMAIIRVMRSLNPDSYEVLHCIDALENINYRDASIPLRDILLRSGNPQASAKIAMLLTKWKDPEAASVIRKYLDANHETVSHLYILETIRTLYRIEGTSSLDYIAGILLKCHPYVQQNIGNDYLGEVRYEPIIINAVKEILEKTNDPNVKKTLMTFIEKNR